MLNSSNMGLLDVDSDVAVTSGDLEYQQCDLVVRLGAYGEFWPKYISLQIS